MIKISRAEELMLLTVDIEDERVLYGLERHVRVEGLAPQSPAMVLHAGPELDQRHVVPLQQTRNFFIKFIYFFYIFI